MELYARDQAIGQLDEHSDAWKLPGKWRYQQTGDLGGTPVFPLVFNTDRQAVNLNTKSTRETVRPAQTSDDAAPCHKTISMP